MDSPSQSLRLRVVDVTRVEDQRLDVTARDLKSDQNIRILIGGVWSQNNIGKNTVLHLLNPIYDSSSQIYTVDNSTGLLVVEPDSLLTCTYVASSLFCERKTWLNHVFLGDVGTNRAMLVGTLVHEVFQHGLKKRLADIDKLTAFLDELLDDATVMLEIYSVEAHISDIRKEAIAYISSVKEWIEKYMFSGPRHALTNNPDLEVKVVGVRDIEENVWSPKYGLKGKIDVTGEVRVYDRRTKLSSDKIIPLELKTGNPNLSASHAAQVSLYSMMIEDRYATTNQGFVIYLKDKAAMHNVSLTHNIKRDLVQRRNQINYHMKSFFNGPDMIDQTRMCSNCERLTECVLISDIYSPGKIDSFPSMKALEPEAIGHLDGAFKKLFKDYHEQHVTTLTAQMVNGSFWTYSSEAAESKKSGFGKLQAETSKDGSPFVVFSRHPNFRAAASPSVATKRLKISDYFKPLKVEEPRGKGRPFDLSVNVTGCRFAISLDDDRDNMDNQNSSTAIAIGFINQVLEDRFTMKIYEGGANLLKPDQVYRVDKIEKRAQIDIDRTILVKLMARGDWRCDRIRRLLLDPNYKPVENVELNLFVLSTAFDEISSLDEAKQKFVVEAASTDNYCVLNESVEPNRDKVHKIISVFIKVVHTLERSALIVARNIDHLCDIMTLLQSKKIKFILIDDGKSSKARHLFAGNLVKVLQSPNLDIGKKFDAYIRQHELAPVVVTTYAMSVGGLLFTRRKFDYCVAYDCDRTELLVSLAPMFCSERIIIIDVNDGSDQTVVSLGKHLRALSQRPPIQ